MADQITIYIIKYISVRGYAFGGSEEEAAERLDYMQIVVKLGENQELIDVFEAKCELAWQNESTIGVEFKGVDI